MPLAQLRLPSPRTLTRPQVRQAWIWFFVALGVLARFLEYQDNRLLYQDEYALLDNLVKLEVLDLHTTLTREQLAPPGFLIAERLLVRLPLLDHRWSGRFLPFACAIASMVLFPRIARRALTPGAVPLAVGLFALGYWLIYYAAEMKQYSTDLLLILVALDLALDLRPAGTSPGRSPRAAGVGLAALGIAGVWFSYPLVFMLAGVGLYWLVLAARARDWRMTANLVLMGLIWCFSFFVCYRVSHRILSKGDFIWVWWDFAFLRLPPSSWADAEMVFWQVVNVFNSPGDIVTRLPIAASSLLGLVLFTAGAIRMFWARPGTLWLLLTPWIFVIVASALHQYPFHGRLLLFLVPSIHLLVAEGVVALTFFSWPLGVVLAGFMLWQPAGDLLHHRLIQHRTRSFDSHGDIRPDLLDHFEAQLRQAAPQ